MSTKYCVTKCEEEKKSSCFGLRKALDKGQAPVQDLEVCLLKLFNIYSSSSIVITQARTHVLTRIENTQKGVMKKESDHNALLAKFNCEIEGIHKNKKHEVYNLKNADCQKKFYEYTSNTRMLSSIFDAEEDLNILTNRL